MDIRGSFSFNRASCNCECHKPSRCLHCNCDGYGNCATVIPHPTLENPNQNRASLNSHEENQEDCGAEKSKLLSKPKLSLLGSFSSPLCRGLSIRTRRVCQDSDFVYFSPGKRIAKCIASALRNTRKKLKFEVGMGNGSSTVTIKRCESAPLTVDPFQRRRDDVGKKQVFAECKSALPYWHLSNQGDDVESEYSHDEESGYSSSDLFELKNLHT